jgi:tRNA nucleotidyltransferase (CCA-adding enzyme)
MYIGMDKSRIDDYKETKKKILGVIKPTDQQVLKEKDFTDAQVKRAKNLPGKHIDVVLAGSAARNTNLKETKDFDIFVLYPKDMDREEFTKEALELGANFFKGNFSEKVYSEHPYVRGIIEGYKIDLVPAYKIESTDEMISSVDRTPFHLEFVLKNLKDSQKDDVRFLKYFLKYIGAYGADPQFQGFSGYLCELLIIYYGDFLKTIEKVANWQTPVRIVLNQDDIDCLAPFDDAFVVIDPVDKKRNVASAVSMTQLSRFIASARSFQNKPTTEFFSGTPKIQTYHQLVTWANNVPLVAIEFEVEGMLKDIVWSKVRRLSNKLTSHLEAQKFTVLKSTIYYEEKSKYAYIIMMLDMLTLPKFERTTGPFVSDMTNSQKFVDNSKTIYGPFVKDDRWYCVKARKLTEIKDIFDDFSSSNFDIKSSIFVEQEIIKLYTKNTDILPYFTDFFYPRENFL